MSKFSKWADDVKMKFANFFTGPTLKAFITVAVIFVVLGIIILAVSL